MVKQLNIKIWLLKFFCTPGPTRIDTNLVDSPAHFSQLTQPYKTIRFVCNKFTDILQERPTFTFNVENTTYCTLISANIERNRTFCFVCFLGI
jgi:hypothetical protein